MVAETFADGIGRIGFADGMVRIELVSRSGAAFAGEEPRAEVQGRIVMTPQAFLQSLMAQQQALLKLEEAGVIRRSAPRGQDGGQGSGKPNAEPGAAAAGKPRSPN